MGALAGNEAAPESGKRGIALGFDNFSVRAFGWKAVQLLEYAAKLELDAVLLSDLQVYESHSEAHLKEVKARADHLGIRIQAGTGSICPTSARFDRKLGEAGEHLQLAIRVARAVGSDVVRCFLGSMDDRKGPGGIEPHIESTVKTLKAARSYGIDAGVKIAVENHAGDLQAGELARLVEEAGKDWVGVTIDSGNATWALEDPVKNIEILGPYALSSGIRDSMIWEDAAGAVVQWTAMGEGCVDLRAYVDRYQRLCPKAPLHLEIISGFPRAFPYLREDFWGPYARTPAPQFAAFLALAKRGRALKPFEPPAGVSREEATREYQRDQLERSVRYCKEVLGLGLR